MPKVSPSSTPESDSGVETARRVCKDGRVLSPNFCGKKGRSGLKKGQMNALKHGKALNYKRLVVGELPGKMIAIKREARRYRKGLETEVLNVKGEINLLDAHAIDTASAAVMAAGISRWLLRQRIEEMTVNDIRQCGMDQMKAKIQRDKAIARLGLDIKPETISLDKYVLDSSKVKILSKQVVN